MKEQLLNNLQLIHGRLMKFGEQLTSEDIVNLANDIGMSERQVRKYKSLLSHYGYSELVGKIRQGESINGLTKSITEPKTAIVRASQLLSKEYNITPNMLRSLLMPYRKGEVLDFGEEEE